MAASSKKRTELLQALETLKDSTCKPGSGCLRYRFFPGAGLHENQDRGRDHRFTVFWRFPSAQFFDAFLLTYSRCFIKKMIGLKAIRSTRGERQVTGGNGRNFSGREGWISPDYESFLAQ